PPHAICSSASPPSFPLLALRLSNPNPNPNPNPADLNLFLLFKIRQNTLSLSSPIRRLRSKKRYEQSQVDDG
ncbi:hypothetical protein QQP08_005981, partial [Theobroma cacao]